MKSVVDKRRRTRARSSLRPAAVRDALPRRNGHLDFVSPFLITFIACWVIYWIIFVCFMAAK